MGGYPRSVDLLDPDVARRENGKSHSGGAISNAETMNNVREDVGALSKALAIIVQANP